MDGVGQVVPHMSRLPANRAIFWSAGLVKGNTSSFCWGRNGW